jgi:4-phosphopantoate--beta-alanine ligase
VDLSAATGAHLEINLFYREEGRVPAIQALLESRGAHLILGTGDVSPVQIQELSSNRRIVDPRGIAKADVVLVPLEDGDRTEALVREGKYVIAIDLNPLSRTAQYADLTIVDNITRCLPALVTASTDLRSLAATDAGREQLAALCASFDQAENLSKTLEHIITRLQGLAAAGRSLGPRGDMTHD